MCDLLDDFGLLASLPLYIQDVDIGNDEQS